MNRRNFFKAAVAGSAAAYFVPSQPIEPICDCLAISEFVNRERPLVGPIGSVGPLGPAGPPGSRGPCGQNCKGFKLAFSEGSQ